MPGPKYDLDNTFKVRCKGLSEYYRGTIITSGDQYLTKHYNDFKVICFKDPLTNSFISSIIFFFSSLYLLTIGTIKNDRYSAYITYDPIKSGLIGLVLKKITRTPLIVEINGDYTQDVNYLDVKNPLKRYLKKWFMVRIETIILNKADGIKILHETQINSFKPLKNAPQFGCFPDYTDSDAFSNLGETKNILLVGFPFKVKGVDILIQAFKLIADKNPDWNVTILGWYPDTQELQSHINRHPQISHHPPVHRDDMIKHIGRCGIFVSASRTEGVARVLIEAMAAGKPRIASNVGGTSTTIKNEIDGLLFDSEDVNKLAFLMDKLISDSSLRQTLGVNARIRYEAEFGTDNYFKALHDFYSRLLLINHN